MREIDCKNWTDFPIKHLLVSPQETESCATWTIGLTQQGIANDLEMFTHALGEPKHLKSML